MQARHEITFTFAVLLVIQLATIFGAIGLLARMSPAVERVLLENVVSLEAVEVMHAAVAEGGAEARLRFEEGLGRAERSLTEDAEEPLVETIRARGEAAFAGDPRARRAVLEALIALSEVNRASIREADEETRRLGFAGAWAAVVLGVVAFSLNIAVARRLTRRLEVPIEELARALRQVREGDPLRRISLAEGPRELLEVAAVVNELLDRRQRAPVTPSLAPAASDLERRALPRALDASGLPVLLVDDAGRLRAASRGALALPDGLQARLRAEEDEPGWTRIPVPGEGGWLVVPAEAVDRFTPVAAPDA